MDNQLNALGFSPDHKLAIYMVLSSILNIGNIQFNDDDDNIGVEVNTKIFLCNAAALLKVNESELESVLISHTREVEKLQIK